nr:hypothetical protein [Tanacetum cinerariifolium]
MTTLVEFMIIAGADNRPPMLEKSLYDSWKTRMELYIENRENERMILNSIQNGPLVWTTIVKEDCTTRTKMYEELSVAEKLQAVCNLQATNIVLQSLLPDVYAIVNHHKVAKEIWDRVKLHMQGMKLSLQEMECKLRQGQSYVGTGYKGNATSSEGNNAGGKARVVKCYNCQGEGHMARQCTQPKRPRNSTWFKEKATLAEAHESRQILDEEQLAFFGGLGIPNGQAAQTTIPNTATFQTEDLVLMILTVMMSLSKSGSDG